MPDREKVSSAIDKCLNGLCEICSYKNDHRPGGCRDSLLADALFLLRDIRPIVTTNAYGKKFYKCATCGYDFELDFGQPRRVKVCRNCGQGVKWDA